MKLELRRLTVPSPRAENARKRWPERQSLLVRITDAQGRAGVGEASPLPDYSPDRLDEVEQALAQVEPDALERRLDGDAAPALLGAVGQLVPPSLPSARMALETAALDYLGQRTRRSAPALLGATPDAERPLAELVGSPLRDAFAAACEDALKAGFRRLKVKLGAPEQLEQEVSALLAVARQLGKAVSFRADANRAWAASEVERAWTLLEPLELELLEEPGALPAQLLGRLPLALDESLQSLEAAAAVEQLRASQARFAVLKPMALGGLSHCWELAQHACAVGIQPLLSHCFDGPVALRAAAALALALPTEVAHGLAPHAGLSGYPSPEPPVERGWLKTWSEPGLGLRAGSAFE
jgi:L-alanine-DL-glutamate epimerase-like enolase superfamily enzyme